MFVYDFQSSVILLRKLVLFIRKLEGSLFDGAISLKVEEFLGVLGHHAYFGYLKSDVVVVSGINSHALTKEVRNFRLVVCVGSVLSFHLVLLNHLSGVINLEPELLFS